VPELTTEADLSAVLDLERELQTKKCRSDRARMRELLAPDFTEVGASGRVWDLVSVLELLDAQAGDRQEIEVTNLTGRILGNGFILVRWDSAYRGRRSRRTSLWRRDAGGWRQVHHQGTVLSR
jgi:hypothetical protein